MNRRQLGCVILILLCAGQAIATPREDAAAAAAHEKALAINALGMAADAKVGALIRCGGDETAAAQWDGWTLADYSMELAQESYVKAELHRLAAESAQDDMISIMEYEQAELWYGNSHEDWTTAAWEYGTVNP